MSKKPSLLHVVLAKRVFLLFLACVLSLAGVLQLRASAASLLNEEKVSLQRLYEEIAHTRVDDLRAVEQRQGLKPREARWRAEHPTVPQAPLRAASVLLPSAPRAPPHVPRAPPFFA